VYVDYITIFIVVELGSSIIFSFELAFSLKPGLRCSVCLLFYVCELWFARLEPRVGAVILSGIKGDMSTGEGDECLLQIACTYVLTYFSNFKSLLRSCRFIKRLTHRC
jgi:hypothetical protein